MTDDRDFLKRWSRRKLESKTRENMEAQRSSAQPVVPVRTGIQPTPAAARAPVAGVVPESSGTELPPVESLTPESDFAPFMQPGVDPGVKREALKTLLRDERFNVMDGLDVYIDDYSKPDPIPAEWLGQLKQLERLGHYLEPEEKPAESAVKEGPAAQGEPVGEPQTTMQEEPVSFPDRAPLPDTASKDPHAPE